MATMQQVNISSVSVLGKRHAP